MLNEIVYFRKALFRGTDEAHASACRVLVVRAVVLVSLRKTNLICEAHWQQYALVRLLAQLRLHDGITIV